MASGSFSSEPTGGDIAIAPPTGGGNPLAGPTAAVSAAQVRSLLLSQLLPSGKAARLKALLKAGAFSQFLKALTAGRVTINWYQLPPGAKLAKKAKPILIASGGHTFTAAGAATVKIKLTAAGKRLIKHAKKFKLTARGTFTRAGQPPVTTTRTFTLKK